MCSFLQDGLKNFILSGFEDLLCLNFSQQKIKPFQIILQVFAYISAQCQVNNLLPVSLLHLLPETEYNR